MESNREGYFLNLFCFSIYYLVGFQERQESIKNNYKKFRNHWLNSHWTVITRIVFIIFCGAVLIQYLLFTLRRQPLFNVCDVFKMDLGLRLIVKWMWMNRWMYRTNSFFLYWQMNKCCCLTVRSLIISFVIIITI